MEAQLEMGLYTHKAFCCAAVYCLAMYARKEMQDMERQKEAQVSEDLVLSAH